ncbi:MAG: cupin-like domain-containing protein [Pseudomonadota bacterium]
MASAHRQHSGLDGASDANLLTDDAKRWIAENLLLGATNDDIASRLVQLGCPLSLALSEIRHASESPYLKGAEVLRQRLAKRDWLLASYGRLATLDGGLDTVPLVHKLGADAFFRDYYSAHRPIVIDGLIDHWPALDLWSLDDFERRLSDATIEVQTGRSSDPDYEARSDSHKESMTFGRFLEMLRDVEESNDFYVTANNGGRNRTALAPLWDDIGGIDGYLESKSEQDGFFWMGPKGTITPFHHDLTNNLLIQIKGRKKVTLVPSWDTPLMRNSLHCYSGWTGPEALASLPDSTRPTIMQCTIEPGQALFIPLGWWHHVTGLDMTVSMSFTNFRRTNDFARDYTTYGQV